MRIFAATRTATLVVLAAAVLPRLGVLLYERGAILGNYLEKSDIFARTFLASGTYGFVPGVPSAYTQPLYGWFLIPLYWLDRTWWLVGGAQIAVAACTALLVLAIGRRELGPRGGLVAALVQTLNPYLLWHDVHVNREILDQLLAAALFGLVLLVARRGTLPLAAATGAVAGLAILGNSRLAALPLALCVYVGWHQRARWLPLSAVLLSCAFVVVLPWLVRNDVQVGCFTITTDAHALWKANNVNTYSTLARGGWIDEVPPLPGAPSVTPAFEPGISGLRVDECAQMRLYERATIRFLEHHPTEKLKLMRQATWMLWDPQQTQTASGPGGRTGALRAWIEAAWAIPVYALALIGLFVVRRRLAALALVFLGYDTLAACVFAGATRYRIAFDFVLALLAAAAVERAVRRLRS